jgi:hypothetical protein
MSWPELRSTETATIANGASLSGAVDLTAGVLVGIQMPTWTAAVLTFQGSADDTTYTNVYTDGGSEFTVQTASDRFVQVDPVDFVGIRYLKVRSGTSGSAVNQGAERVLTLVVRPI